MEPITWAFLGSILLPILQGAGGNVATGLINAPVRYIRDRLSVATPAARLIEREVSLALLRATALACRSFQREIRSADRADRPALTAWFYKADDFLINETARIQLPGTPASLAASDAGDTTTSAALLALLRGESAPSAVDLATIMREYLAGHIGSATPDRFTALLTSPWPPSRANRGEHTSWFETATALFTQQLAHDEELRTAVTNALLTGLTVSVDRLTGALADSSATALDRIDAALSSLAELKGVLGLQSESIADLERWLGKLVEAALLQAPASGPAVTVPDVLAALQHDAARAARGLWAGERTEELLDEKSSGFVGREWLLDELDRWLTTGPSRICVVAGKAGMGKTSLLAYWIRTRQRPDVYCAYHFFSQSRRALTEWKRGVDNLIRQIRAYRGDGERVTGLDRAEDELYDLLRQQGRAAQPLVVIIDAIEESDQRDLTDLPVPKALPEGVCVLVSARAAEGESPPYLDWTRHVPVNRIDVGPFSVTETAEYLSESGLAGADPGVTARIHERTTGYPLFTSYLAETIADRLETGADFTSMLASVPQNFSDYITGELRRIDMAGLREPAWRLLMTLAVALGPLRGGELRDAASVVDIDFDALLARREVTRWIRTEAAGGQPEYALDHPAIGEALRERLPDSAARADSALAECCRQWWPRGSGYALRNYPSHLLRRARRDPAGPDAAVLYALIADGAFTARQEEILPNERALPLRTILTGVQCAIDRQEAARTVAFALRYAWKKNALSRISPLSEQKPATAWGLADLWQPSRRSLWLLLLAWSEVIGDDDEAAARTMEHLLDGETVRLTDPDAALALLILTAGLSHVAALGRVAERLLPPDARAQLLIDTARLPEAEAAALSVADRGKRSDLLEKIAAAWAEDNRYAEASRVIEIKREVDRIPGFPHLEFGLYRIDPARAEHVAEARRRGEISPETFDDPQLQIKVDVAAVEGQAPPGSGTELAALQQLALRADSVDDPHGRAMSLTEVAAAQSRAGDAEAAAATFARAMAAALASTSGQQSLAVIVWRVADWQAAYMGAAAAARTLSRAEREARRVDPEWQRDEALSRVAGTYARAGRIHDAQRLLAEIASPLHRVHTLLAIARSRTDAQRSQALAEIGLALDEAWRVTGPGGVAPIVDCVMAFAQAGDRERARSTLREACQRIAREDGPARAPRLLALARAETRLAVPVLAVEALSTLLLGPAPGAGWDAGVAAALAELSEMFEAAGRQPRAAELRTSATRLALGLPAGKIRVQALAGLIPIVALNEPGADLDRIVTAAVDDFTGLLGADRDERDLDATNERLRIGQPLQQALLEIGSAEASRVDLGWEEPEERQWALMRRAERLAARGRFPDAEQKATELEDPESGCWAWSAIGSARLRFGDLDGAERAWDQAQRVARQIPELSARVRNLTQLAQTQLDAGRTELARAVLTDASEALRLEAEHPPERPQSQSLRLAAEATAIERSGLPPSELSARLAELAAAARAIPPGYPEEMIKALSCIAAAQARAGLATDADTTLAGLRPELAAAGQESWLAEAASMLRAAQIEAAMGHADHARADVADQIARAAGERFSGLEWRVRSMAGIISAAAGIGLADEAGDARRQAWAMATEAADTRQQVTVMAAIAQHEQLAGFGADAGRHFAGARRIADAINAPNARIRALIDIGRALGEAGRAGEALATLSDAAKQAETLQQSDTCVEALSALAGWQRELGHATQATRTCGQLIAAAQNLRREPHRWQHDDLLRQAVAVVARIGGREQAAAFELAVLPDELLHDHAAMAVVDYAVRRARAGDLDEARMLLGSEPFAWGWWRGLAAIADALAGRGDLAGASTAYAQAAAAAQRDPGLSTGEAEDAVARNLLGIATLYARRGDAQTALSLIGAKPDAGPPRFSSTYAPELARILALSGMTQEAERLLGSALEAAQPRRERDWYLAQIAEAQGMLPDVTRFFATCQQISDPATTASVLGRVAAGWARAGRVPEAVSLVDQIHAEQWQSLLPLAEELATAGRRTELLELAGRHLDHEFTLTVCPLLALADPGSLDGIADTLLRLAPGQATD